MINYKLILILLLITTIGFSQTVKNDGALVVMSDNVLVKLSNGSIENANNGMFKGEGSILCNSFSNSSNINVSTFNNIGSLLINGDLINETLASAINLKIEGTNGQGIAGGNDVLEVDGDLQLGNILNISFLNNFVSTETDQFIIITYTGNLTDTFQQVNLPSNLNGFQIDYNTQGEIKLKAAQLSVNEFDLNKISVFPNPASNILNIKTDNLIQELVVFDLLGKVISRPKPTNQSINVSALAKGMYLLQIKINNMITTKKIIIE